MRIDTVVRGLALAGEVDVFATVSERPDLDQEIPHVPPGVGRVHVQHRDPFGPSPHGLWRWLTTDRPRGVAWREWDAAAAKLSSFARPPYDLCWYSPAGTWLALRAPLGRRTVVDFNDLEDELLKTLRRLRRVQHERLPLVRRVRRALGAALDSVDVGRWRRLQQRAADSVDASVVCSDLDRTRLSRPRVVVVPNSYELPDPPSEHVPPAEPTFTMVGLLSYPPNQDAAALFARTILPLIRARLPDARFVLVGGYDEATAPLGDEPGVELRGYVRDLEEVFAATTAVVVPVRAGGGTRIKILEAFARRLPVVSTTVGCEGLDAHDGQELLIAEGAADFADACVRVFEDGTLAGSLAERGQALWSSRYRSEDVRAEVCALAQKLVNAGQPGPSAGSADQ